DPPGPAHRAAGRQGDAVGEVPNCLPRKLRPRLGGALLGHPDSLAVDGAASTVGRSASPTTGAARGEMVVSPARPSPAPGWSPPPAVRPGCAALAPLGSPSGRGYGARRRPLLPSRPGKARPLCRVRP